MIKNERQYKITRSRADEVRNTIGELQRAPLPDGLQAEMRELQFDALRGTLGDLEAELAEFDALHDATLIEATGIEQLPTALIRARIACGLTQRQLAERVGLQEQASSVTRRPTTPALASPASSRSPGHLNSPSTTTSGSPRRADHVNMRHGITVLTYVG